MQADCTSLRMRWPTKASSASPIFPKPHSKLCQSARVGGLVLCRNASSDVSASVSLNGAPETVSERAPVAAAPTVHGETELVFQREETTKYEINVIPKSRWPDGIPAVMGAHLMASGTVAPVSTSKGVGIGLVPHMFGYPDELDGVSILQFANEKSASVGLGQLLEDLASRAIKERGAFVVAASASLLADVASHLGSVSKEDLQKWHVAFTELELPEGGPPSPVSPASAVHALETLAKAGVPAAQIHVAQAGLSAEHAAVEYAGQLLRLPPSVLPRTAEGFPRFDAVVLEVARDGRVAGLFPNRKETAATEGWFLPVSRPGNPPLVTLTLPAINSAEHVVLAALGEAKAEVVQRVLEVQALPGAVPAQLVRPPAGHLTWLLDSASSESLSVSRWQQKGAFPRSTLPGPEEA
eukprot:jgi/Botrbrau1/22480/Bobra.114_2s0010.1